MMVEIFILMLADDGFAELGETSPVNLAQRIARSIIAQANEFL